MGYYIVIEESNVVLTQENQEAILQRWKDLNSTKNDNLKRGGRWSEGEKVASWYFFLDQNYDQNVKTCEEMLEMLGFEFEIQDNSDIKINSYDRKTGQEDLFFKAVADLIPAGQYMHWRGEDGETFSWVFNGKQLLEVNTKEAMKMARKIMVDMATQSEPTSVEKETQLEQTTKKSKRYAL